MIVRNSFGDENSAPMAQDDEPDERGDRERVERVPVDRVPVERLLVDRARELVAGFFAAGLAAEAFAAALRERVVEPLDRDVEPLERDVEAPERDAEPLLLAAVERDAAVEREEDVRERALLTALPSSAATRARRLSTSLLRSSSTFRSAIASRKRAAAWATSSTRSRPRLPAPPAPSLVALNVRSTALRTASTGSVWPEPFLSFFFLSFFAMARV
jgi:hypothetical protein